jgi:hypothetical protein
MTKDLILRLVNGHEMTKGATKDFEIADDFAKKGRGLRFFYMILLRNFILVIAMLTLNVGKTIGYSYSLL